MLSAMVLATLSGTPMPSNMGVMLSVMLALMLWQWHQWRCLNSILSTGAPQLNWHMVRHRLSSADHHGVVDCMPLSLLGYCSAPLLLPHTITSNHF